MVFLWFSYGFPMVRGGPHCHHVLRPQQVGETGLGALVDALPSELATGHTARAVGLVARAWVVGFQSFGSFG